MRSADDFPRFMRLRRQLWANRWLSVASGSSHVVWSPLFQPMMGRRGYRGQGGRGRNAPLGLASRSNPYEFLTHIHFDLQGSVAKSTHAGLRWLRYLCQKVGGRIHYWPFDGWEIPTGRSVVAEVYPRLWSGVSSAKFATPTSMTPIRSPRGCASPISTAASRNSSAPLDTSRSQGGPNRRMDSGTQVGATTIGGPSVGRTAW
jgi:hypothetical protein